MYAPVELNGVRLETERLLLRPLAWEDLPDFYAYCSVPGVGKLAGWPHHESLEDSAEALQLMMEDGKTFALQHKATGRMIGTVGIDELETPPEIENCRGLIMGYDLNMDYWGQGLMPEAIRAVAAFVFETLGYDYVSAGISPENRQSRRCVEKCGFTFHRVRDFSEYNAPDDHLYLLKRGDHHARMHESQYTLSSAFEAAQY